MSAAFIPLDLHIHTIRWEGQSLLLSRDGVRGNAHHIPKSLILDPNVSTQIVNSGSEATRKGHFHIAKWKAEELGWLAMEHEGQGRLAI